MNKKFFVSTLIVFVALMAVGFVVHGTLLHSEYLQLGNMFRPEEDAKQYCLFMIGAHVLMAAGLVWVYRQGKNSTPFVKQGLRFGLAIAAVSAIPLYLIYYSVQPLPGMLVAKQIVFDTLGMMAVGVILAWSEK